MSDKKRQKRDNEGLPETAEPADFNTALTELEKLVNQLESGDLSLEQSLQCYRRGIALVRFCEQTLDQTEAEIKVLIEAEDGEPQLADMPEMTDEDENG